MRIIHKNRIWDLRVTDIGIYSNCSTIRRKDARKRSTTEVMTIPKKLLDWLCNNGYAVKHKVQGEEHGRWSMTVSVEKDTGTVTVYGDHKNITIEYTRNDAAKFLSSEVPRAPERSVADAVSKSATVSSPSVKTKREVLTLFVSSVYLYTSQVDRRRFPGSYAQRIDIDRWFVDETELLVFSDALLKDWNDKNAVDGEWCAPYLDEEEIGKLFSSGGKPDVTYNVYIKETGRDERTLIIKSVSPRMGLTLAKQFYPASRWESLKVCSRDEV